MKEPLDHEDQKEVNHLSKVPLKTLVYLLGIVLGTLGGFFMLQKELFGDIDHIATLLGGGFLLCIVALFIPEK